MREHDGGANMWFSDDEDGEGRVFMNRAPRVRRQFDVAREYMEQARDAQQNAWTLHAPDHSIDILRDRVAGGALYEFRQPGAFGFMQFDDNSAEERRELRELEQAVQKTAQAARNSEGAERDELEAKLDELLDQALELKQAMQEQEIRHMEERLNELKERFDMRQNERREVLQRRKRELLGRRDPLDW
jgi:hypothetical protein